MLESIKPDAGNVEHPDIETLVRKNDGGAEVPSQRACRIGNRGSSSGVRGETKEESRALCPPLFRQTKVETIHNVTVGVEDCITVCYSCSGYLSTPAFASSQLRVFGHTTPWIVVWSRILPGTTHVYRLCVIIETLVCEIIIA